MAQVTPITGDDETASMDDLMDEIEELSGHSIGLGTQGGTADEPAR